MPERPTTNNLTILEDIDESISGMYKDIEIMNGGTTVSYDNGNHLTAVCYQQYDEKEGCCNRACSQTMFS